jgi:ketosteroid isomerase-like protein
MCARLTSGVELIRAANQRLVSAIGARDIDAMDKVWAHEVYASFIGPLSSTVVVGWDGVRKAWQMQFAQFDRVTISMDDPHVRISGDAGWAVGMEKVELLRKDGRTISFDAFVTNIFENKGGKWLLVAHRRPPLRPSRCRKSRRPPQQGGAAGKLRGDGHRLRLLFAAKSRAEAWQSWTENLNLSLTNTMPITAIAQLHC